MPGARPAGNSGSARPTIARSPREVNVTSPTSISGYPKGPRAAAPRRSLHSIASNVPDETFALLSTRLQHFHAGCQLAND